MMSRSTTYGNILQVFPATPGWEAVYAYEGEEYGTEPILCWAVLERPSGRPGDNVQLVGMVAGGEGLEVAWATHFLGYAYPECKIDWAQLAGQYNAQRR
jgi:hypothetical protein